MSSTWRERWWDEYPAGERLHKLLVGRFLLLDLRPRERRHPDDFDPIKHEIADVISVTVGLDDAAFFCGVTVRFSGHDGLVTLFNDGDIQDEENGHLGKHELTLTGGTNDRHLEG